MKWYLVGSTTAVLCLLFSVPLLVCATVGYLYNEELSLYFLSLAIITGFLGGLFFLLSQLLKRERTVIGVREGFFIVTFSYVLLGLMGSIPFTMGSEPTTNNLADAVFESFSAWTTTGSTVLVGLDELPRSILFYRSILQWIGGMGIIVLAVAILPTLGIGGMQLFRAESPGTIDDTSLEPRITKAAKSLWVLYFCLTIACGAAYFLGGMSLFDAVCHALTTIAIGGFSTHDASIGYFNSTPIESIAMVFMVIAGMNFALHFRAFRFRESTRRGSKNRRDVLDRLRSDLGTIVRSYTNDSEVRLYLLLLVFVGFLVSIWLLSSGYGGVFSLKDAVFQTVSFITTTGYTTTNVDSWPVLCPVLLILASFAGGCTGSTAGGMKIYRVLIVMQQGIREVRRIILPDGIFEVKLGDRVIPDRIIEAVWGFVFMYVACFVVLLVLVLMLSGLDLISAFSAVAACLNNLGPGIGEVANNFGGLNAPTKSVLVIAMLLGRLEIFTVLVLLAPRYWTH